MTKQPPSKAERERRRYIEQTAQRVAIAVVNALASKDLDEMRQRRALDHGERLRNAGARQIVQALSRFDDEVILAAVREIARWPDSPWPGFRVFTVCGEQMYPLPVQESTPDAGPT